jgi:alpha-ketoglutarate-dependent taurine dioxygenase
MMKFGSVEWQEHMLRRVQIKIASRKKLDAEEQAFLQVQTERLLREGKLTHAQYRKLKRLW